MRKQKLFSISVLLLFLERSNELLNVTVHFVVWADHKANGAFIIGYTCMGSNELLNVTVHFGDR